MAERALAANPNSSSTIGELGLFAFYTAHFDWSTALLEKAIAMTPRPPYWVLQGLTLNNYKKKNYEAALTTAIRAITDESHYTYFALAIVHAQLGNNEEARDATAMLLEMNPSYASREGAKADLEPWTWALPGEFEHWMEGLEKAGLFDEPEAPSRPVIAVLPFTNMSGDPEQEWFADGITEDIITRLARFPDIGVIARNSSFQYKGENVDVRAVAVELGATYVLEGSVRRSENNVRVTAQLLDASDGTQLWAETYDRDLSVGGIFDIQDNVTERVVGAIASSDSVIAMAVAHSSETKAPADLESYECVLRAGEYWRVTTPDVHLRVRSCLEQVISKEPNYAQAVAFLAAVTIEESLYGFNPRPDMAPPLDRALGHARQAVNSDPGSGWAHWALARTAFFRHDMRIFHTETDRALELAPNDTFILAAAGLSLAYSGSWERAMSLMARAIELNPHHQTWYHFPYFYDAYRQGHNEAALAAALQINMPGFFWNHVVLAAAYGQLGLEDEASSSVGTLHDLYPGFSVSTLEEHLRIWNFEEGLIDRMADGLRKAGLPEVSG
jgi:adenylate cyclase